jgi:hypothetical protein
MGLPYVLPQALLVVFKNRFFLITVLAVFAIMYYRQKIDVFTAILLSTQSSRLAQAQRLCLAIITFRKLLHSLLQKSLTQSQMKLCLTAALRLAERQPSSHS